MYSTHAKKKAYSVSKMTSGSAPEGEVSVTLQPFNVGAIFCH